MLSRTRWFNLLSAAGGLLFVALLQVGHESVAGAGLMPATIASPVRDYTAFISETLGTTSYFAGQVIGFAGYGCLLLFMAALGRTLREAGSEPSELARIAYGSSVVGVLFMLAAAGQQFAVAIRFDEGLDPVAATTLFNVGEVLFMLAWLPLAIAIGAYGVEILRTGALSRWLGGFSCVVAAGLPGFATALPAETGYMGFGLFLLWSLVGSVVLVIRTVRSAVRTHSATAPMLNQERVA